MCSAMASAFVEQIVFLGAKPMASELQSATLSLNLASQIAAGKQPPGKKIPPLVPAASEDKFSGLGGILYNDKGMVVNWLSPRQSLPV